MNSKMDQFYITFTNRMSSTKDDNVVRDITDILIAYSNNYSFFIEELDTKKIPSSYNNVEDDMDNLKKLIDNSKEFCEDEELEECKNAIGNYEEMDELVESINETIVSYSSSSTCTNEQTKHCNINGGSGTQICRNGVWGSCVANSGGGYNLILIAGLVIVLLALVAFKFKDNIMESISGGSEPEEDTGGWQSQWNQ